MWLLSLFACDFSAASTLVTDTGGPEETDTDTDTDADADTDTDTDTDTAPPDPLEVDDDGDGVSEMDGDCDDEDRTVVPGAEDVCNGIDDDCDRDVDEDADPDGYEPNDDDAYYIGSLADDPEYSIVGALAWEGDVDRYSFGLSDDTFDFFTVTMTLSGIPDDATWRFTLNRLTSNGDEPIEEVDQVFGSGSLTLTMEDETLVEDGGTYELVIESIAGADCGRSYLLAIAK